MLKSAGEVFISERHHRTADLYKTKYCAWKKDAFAKYFLSTDGDPDTIEIGKMSNSVIDEIDHAWMRPTTNFHGKIEQKPPDRNSTESLQKFSNFSIKKVKFSIFFLSE